MAKTTTRSALYLSNIPDPPEASWGPPTFSGFKASLGGNVFGWAVWEPLLTQAVLDSATRNGDRVVFRADYDKLDELVAAGVVIPTTLTGWAAEFATTDTRIAAAVAAGKVRT